MATWLYTHQPQQRTAEVPRYENLNYHPNLQRGRESLTLLQAIFSFAPLTDVLIVDDHSPDGTGELADSLQRKDVRLHVLHRTGKLGLGTAYLSGFKFALAQGYDVAFEMDADFSHDPRYLPAFLRAVEDADVVIGSRYMVDGGTPNWSALRRLISGSGNIFARLMLGIPIHDCTSGFRCYRRRVLESIDLDAIQSRGYAFQVELTYRVMLQGFQIIETPIVFRDRRCGKSKMSYAIILEALTYVLRTRLSQQAPPLPHVPLTNYGKRESERAEREAPGSDSRTEKIEQS